MRHPSIVWSAQNVRPVADKPPNCTCIFGVIAAETFQPTNSPVTYRTFCRLFKLPSLQYDVGLSAPSQATRQEELPAGSNYMHPFRTLEHTADVGFEAFGLTREEVFSNAARALMNIIVDLDTIEPRDQVFLQISGPDPETLLVNWLSEILYLNDAEGWLFRDFEIQSLQDDSLGARARGEKFQRPRHQVKLLVKAITYHQLVLEKTPRGWRAQVYVDI